MINDINENKETNQKNIMTTARAGVVGLLIGAVGTAAIVLADHEMRKRALKKAGELKTELEKMGNKAVKNIQSSAKKTINDSKLKSILNDEKVKDVADKAKEALEKSQEKLSRSVH